MEERGPRHREEVSFVTSLYPSMNTRRQRTQPRAYLVWKELEMHLEEHKKRGSVVCCVSVVQLFSDSFESAQAWLALNVSGGFLILAQDFNLLDL